MKVSVFGLGYVGSVSAASFAADGHTVVGVDVNPDKAASLNEGRSPIVETGLDELIAKAAANVRLRATTSTDEAIECNGSLADVRRHAEPEERQPRSHYLERVCEQIGASLERQSRSITSWWFAARCCRVPRTAGDSRRSRKHPGRSTATVLASPSIRSFSAKAPR